jgi:hypothetical protein
MGSKLGSTTMKTISLLILLTIGGATAASAQSSGCNVASLNGAFGYSLKGSWYDSQYYVYLIGIAGRMVADGNGAITGADTFNFDGYPGKRQYTGSYTVNDDCTGSLVFTTSDGSTYNFDFVIFNDGKEASVVQTDNSYIVTGDLKRQTAPAAPAPTDGQQSSQKK